METKARSEAAASALLMELAAVDKDEALAFGHAWVLAESDEGRAELERYVRRQLLRRALSGTEQ